MIIILITSGISILIVYFLLNKILTNELLNRVTIAANSLAINLTDPILISDKDRIVDLIFNEKFSRKDIVYVMVIDEKNQIIESTSSKAQSETLLHKNLLFPGENTQIKSIQYEVGEDIYDIAIRLEYNKGILRTGYYKKQINKAVMDIILFLILGLLVSLSIAIALVFLFVNIIVKPIKDLERMVAEIAAGNLKQKVLIKSNDEIGQLAASFNNMAESLKNTYDNLKEKEEGLKKANFEAKDRIIELKKSNDLQISAKTAMLNLLEDAHQMEQKIREKTKSLEKKTEELSEKNTEILKSLEKEKILEYHLQKERDHVEAIVNSVNDSILVLGISLNVLLVNDSTEKILGKSKNDLVGKYLGDIIDIYKDNKKFSYRNCFILNAVFSENRITTKIGENYSYVDRDGEKIPIVMAVSSLRGTGRDRGVVLMIRDITSEKKLDDAKIGFISTASHQLRTPLTSLRWFSEMLLEGDAGKMNKNQKTFLNNIYEGVVRMINLVNLLLQMARVEAGRVKIEPVAVNLSKMTESVATAFKADLEKKNQKVVIKAIPKKIPDIYMDYDVIWQVLQNLISNAIRYSPKKGVITVKIEKKDKFVELSIKNEGIGIPKSQQERIFEKFYRANNAVQAAPEGSGLGLALVKLLVEGWRGKVWFESKEGKGATFFITIPLSGMEAKEGEVKLAV
ncbi:MAG: ATP-binding protein [bacterium]|nr:ATP-binding protein [bacterium]